MPALLVLLLSACARPPAVTVDDEVLLGKFVEDGKVAAFLGVPFAEPPLGALRWREPQPLTSKVARRDATDFAPACVQTMRMLDWYRSMAVTFGASEDYYPDLETSEDCLYLNIWTPAPDPGEKRPVMVWVHGGSNKSGWSYELNYHGHKLAQRGVVVISVAYRLGAFGFFSHPELPADETQANFGLLDLIAALQWVQRNVAQFGGDPQRVTLFGESSGAENILALMAVPAADGLFQRAILESAAGFGLRRLSTLAAEQQRGAELAAALGLTADDALSSLRALPAETLLQTYSEMFADYYHAPAIDGRLLRDSTWNSLHASALRGRQLIIGTNDHEWYASTAPDTDWDDVAEMAQSLFTPPDDRAAFDIVHEEADPRRAMDRLRTAAVMLCGAQHTARIANAVGDTAWMYHFTRVLPGDAGRSLGAWHGIEYLYAFGTFDSYLPIEATDLELRAKMQDYWISFAASGDPNSGTTPPWPPFLETSEAVQQLGDTVRTIAAPEPKLCALFEQGLTQN